MNVEFCINLNGKLLKVEDIVQIKWTKSLNYGYGGTSITKHEIFGRVIEFDQKTITIDASEKYRSSIRSFEFSEIDEITILENEEIIN